MRGRSPSPGPTATQTRSPIAAIESASTASGSWPASIVLIRPGSPSASFAYEPVKRRRPVARARAPDRRVDGQKKRPIGGQVAGCELVDRPDRLQTQRSSGSLIGERGVDEAIEQDKLASGQQGLERLLDELRARGGVKQRLGTRADPQVGVLDEPANQLRGANAAGFAHQARVDAAPLQGCAERERQRRLAGSVEALDRDQLPARHEARV